MTATLTIAGPRCNAPHKDTDDCSVLALYHLTMPCGCAVDGCARVLARWEFLQTTPYKVRCFLCSKTHEKETWISGIEVKVL